MATRNFLIDELKQRKCAHCCISLCWGLSDRNELKNDRKRGKHWKLVKINREYVVLMNQDFFYIYDIDYKDCTSPILLNKTLNQEIRQWVSSKETKRRSFTNFEFKIEYKKKTWNIIDYFHWLNNFLIASNNHKTYL